MAIKIYNTHFLPWELGSFVLCLLKYMTVKQIMNIDISTITDTIRPTTIQMPKWSVEDVADVSVD